MSTHAAIWTYFNDIQNNIQYKGTYVQFDGYVMEGTGEMLFKFWKNPNDIQKLVKRDIRSIGNSIEDTQFYPDRTSNYMRTNDKSKIIDNNHQDYVYLFDTDNQWYVLWSGEWVLLKDIINMLRAREA